jgi:fluoroquinolone transport system permease protein
MLRSLRALGPIDLHSVRRDALLRWMLVFPLLAAAAARWLVPAISARLLAVFGFDLSAYYLLFNSLLALAVPQMLGLLIGFLLLDQRDDRTLTALQVTPLTLNGYLAYRIALPVGLSLAATLFVLPFGGLSPLAWPHLALVALANGLMAPLVALALAAFASNKVQGFAIAKGMGVIILPPLLAWFAPAPWEYVFGLAPTYWPVKLYWALHAGQAAAPLYLLAGLAYQALLLWWMVGRFNRVMTQ